RPALRPVDEIEVDVVEPEPPQAALQLGRRVGRSRVELRGDEHVLPAEPAPAERFADTGLVAVPLRRVDVAVAQLQGPRHRVDAFPALADLPDAEAERRDRIAVSEHLHRNVGHRFILASPAVTRLPPGRRSPPRPPRPARRRTPAASSPADLRRAGRTAHGAPRCSPGGRAPATPSSASGRWTGPTAGRRP